MSITNSIQPEFRSQPLTEYLTSGENTTRLPVQLFPAQRIRLQHPVRVPSAITQRHFTLGYWPIGTQTCCRHKRHCSWIISDWDIFTWNTFDNCTNLASDPPRRQVWMTPSLATAVFLRRMEGSWNARLLCAWHVN